MSGPQELHISFHQQDTDYDLTLVKGGKSDHSVKINGVTYAVLGNKEKLATACEILNSVSLNSISNSDDLKGRLAFREDISFPSQKAGDVGINTLNTTVITPEENIQRLVPSSGLIESEKIIKPGKGAKMNHLLESWVNDRGFSGTVLVIDNKQPILKCGYGKASLEDHQAMSSTTRFPIGSVTKPITCFAILKLVEKEYFKDSEKHPIKDPAKIKILDFLPVSFQPKGQVRESWMDVTLLDLMNHTSGLPGFKDKTNKKMGDPDRTWVHEIEEAKGGKMSTPLLPQNYFDLISSERLPERDKRGYNYSNFGYHLLGAIIENVSGKPYEDYINDFLQKELGLKSTGYMGTDNSLEKYGMPAIWDQDRGKHHLWDNDTLDLPAEGYSSGGLYSTVDDLKIVTDTIMKSTVIQGEKGAFAHDPGNFRDDFICSAGWNISAGSWHDDSGNNIQEIWKTGAIGGYSSLVVQYPKQNVALFILSNNTVLDHLPDGKERFTSDVEEITANLSHALFISNSNNINVDPSNWEGLYYSAWGITFSIVQQDSKLIFRETRPKLNEIPLSPSGENQLDFLWGPEPQQMHSIKREKDNTLALYGPHPLPKDGLLIEKDKFI
ncbi:MAG: hypothetical protein S4CHLAM123_15670 [Chlamydiales bacterium]|nr:hypothetical protein [Chlamydiales bacterium]